MSEDKNQENMHTLDDKELIRLSRDGNSTAFRELAGRYLGLVRKRTADFHYNRLETEDLFQEGLIGLMNAVRCYDLQSAVPFQAYADTCIKNKMISALRHTETEKNKVHINSISLTEALHLTADSSTQPEERMVEREEERLLQQFLQTHLTDLERRVLFLYLSGYSYQEISDKLSVTKKTCDNAMQRVRKKLKISF